MTAVRWKCAWRFNVVLVFLLAWHSNAVNISADAPYTPYKGSDDKYDFVDVAQQQGEISQSETGQGETSRFFTTGDVDETFWLKHLGEDFKNAIHLQVGGEERCNGVFNMSENGAAYKVQNDDVTINIPVQENIVKLTTIDDKPVEAQLKKKKVKAFEGNKKLRKVRRKHKNEQKSENVAETVDQPKTVANSEKQDTIAAQSLPDNEQQSFTDVLKQSVYKDDLKKYKNFQQINMKYAPENNSTDTKETNTQNDTSTKTMQGTLEERPVVVNLPESSKQIELETNEAPVVVKMPPVIYHSQPTSVRDPDQYADNTETNTQITEGEQGLDGEQTQMQTQTDNTQYTPQEIFPTAMTYDQQQHQQYTLNQHFQQTEPTQTQYHIQMTPPQYTTQHQQTTLQDQQQQQTMQQQQQQQQPIQQSHQQYPTPSYASTNYYNQDVYTTNINTIPMQQHKTLESNAISKSSYGAYDVSQSQPYHIYPEYSRGSRSNGELYQQGL
ncbi:serine/threonine-protein kinase pakD [Ceratitis capitata]|uniref:serine/threonine-protein kinase pakD n=1 Tax=Ceratitis capitata TaxID=7213 RepID=UPI00032A0172|nr:serine/threonine-protein kinase pakD [Ceratitis capitata]